MPTPTTAAPDLSDVPTDAIAKALAAPPSGSSLPPSSASLPPLPSRGQDLSGVPTAAIQKALMQKTLVQSPSGRTLPLGKTPPAPDLSSVPTADIQRVLSQNGAIAQNRAMAQGSPADGVGPGDYTPNFTPPPAAATTLAPEQSPRQSTSLDPQSATADPNGDPSLPVTPAQQAFFTSRQATAHYANLRNNPQATSDQLAAAYGAMQSGIKDYIRLNSAADPAWFAGPDHQKFLQDVVNNGTLTAGEVKGILTLPKPAANGAPSTAPSGLLPFAERILGADGHEGTFHSQLDSLGSTAKSLWNNLTGPQSASVSPGQYADVAAGSSNAEGSDTLLSRMNQQSVAQAPAAVADLTVPGGHAGLLAHGAEAAIHGTLPSFGKSLGPGIESEALNNPVGQMMNVVALVGAGRLPLDAGAAGLLSTGGKLSAAADAAEAAGNSASASALRGFAQKAVAAGEDMKVAATQYGRTITGGNVGDAAMNAAANIARKHFPGTGLADELTNAAMSQSLGKAVIDNYTGYKIMRDQDAGRITPQDGDVNVGSTGAAQAGNMAGAGATSPPASAGSAVGSLGAMQRPTLPAPTASPAAVTSPVLPPTQPPAVPPVSAGAVPAPPMPQAASTPPPMPLSQVPLSQVPLSKTPAPVLPSQAMPPAAQPASQLAPAAVPKPTQLPLLTLPPRPGSAEEKALHPTLPGMNGAGRYTDGTFAPQPPATRLPLSKVPQAPAEASTPLTAQALPAGPPADARLVSGFPVSQLHLDPDRFQYKIGYGKGGSSGSLTDAKAFNPDFAGIVHAWRDPADGKAYVVNGHNRVGLAQRTGTAGIDTRFIDAPDAASARTRGALINIAEGQGTALDAAKVFRENGYTPASLQKIGVNLSGQKATQGLALANLGDGLFSQAMRGQLPLERAAIIGGTLPDHGDQATLIKQIGEKNVTNDDVREMAEAIAAGPKHTSQTSSLFGTDEITSSLAIERAQASSYIKAQLGKDASALSGAAKNADRLKAGNNVIDAETSQKLATAHRQGAEIFDATKNAPGEVSDILNSAAKRIAQAKKTGETTDAIKQDALKQFLQYAQQHFGNIGGGDSHPAGELFGANDDAGTGGSVSARPSGGADPRPYSGVAEPAGAGVRPGGGIYQSNPSRGSRASERNTGQTRDRQSLTASPAITADGRQVALKGKNGTLYVGARAYTDLTDRLGASGTSQGLTLRPEHARQVNLALAGAIRDYQRGFPARVNTPEGKQYVADLNRTASLIKQGIGGKAGLPVVKVEPGQTLSQTKAVARHERTHAASYDYPLSQASRNVLTTQLSDPAHPMHEALTKAQAALTARGYAPEKTWDEIPAVVSAGPSQYEKMGLNGPEAEGLLHEFNTKLMSEHGTEAVRAMFAHGSATARQAAAQPPAKVPLSKSPPLRTQLQKVLDRNASPSEATFVHALKAHSDSGKVSAIKTELAKMEAEGLVTKDASVPYDPRYRKTSVGEMTNTSPDEMRLLTLDEVTDIRKAGLLSSPKTILKAVAAHGAALASDEVARVPAALTDFLVSAATGRDRTIGDVRVQDLVQAAKVGATQGIKLGFQVLKDGAHGLATQGVTNPMLPANHAPFHSGNRLLDTYVNGVFQAHEGAYAALRLFALHRSLLELADVGAINAVRRGLIPKNQQEALRQHFYNAPSNTMMAAAVSAAEEATLTNDNKFSEMYGAAYEKGGPIGRAIMSQTTPFPKVESNISGRSLEMAGGAVYAPLKFAFQVMQKNGYTASDQQKFSKTFGRGLVGVGLIALGIMIGAKKRGQVSDEKHHQPGAVLYGGKSYPTNTVAPDSNLLQLGIDLIAAKEDAGTGTGPSVGDAVRNLLMEQPWAQANPGDLTQMLTSGTDAKRQIGQQAGSYIPSGLADIAAQGDKFKRKQTEPLDYVKNRIPFWRNTLPVATDSLGNPRLEAQNRLFNPFGGTPIGASGTPAMSLMQQDLTAKRDGTLTPHQQASLTLRKSLLDQAGKGIDIRPAIEAAMQSGQMTMGQARHIIAESRMSTVAQKMDLLPLGSALDVYQQASPAEKTELQPVILRKMEGAARGRVLTPQDVQRAQALGIGEGH